jgi:hypothetical protein
VIIELKLFYGHSVTFLECLSAGNQCEVLVLLEFGDDFEVGFQLFVDAEEDDAVPFAALIDFHQCHLLGYQVRFKQTI